MKPIMLISGSRNASDAMLKRAEIIVADALSKGFYLIFGDAPGIDTRVHEAVHMLNPSGLFAGTCYYAKGLLRQKNRYHDIHYINCGDVSYTKRDIRMIRHAKIVFCLWDGHSKGTKHAYDYAKLIGKRAHLETFE